MQTLIYPGFENEPAQIDYGLSPTDNGGIDIVTVHSKRLGLPNASLIVRNDSRDLVLNRILIKDLAGVRIDAIRFFVLFDATDFGKTQGFEFPIELDFEDYRRKGNPYQIDRPIPASWLGRVFWALGFRPVRYWTHDKDIVAGCANFTVPFGGIRSLGTTEVTSLCESVGHPVLGSLPKWLKDTVALGNS